jgi:hypothetical protein
VALHHAEHVDAAVLAEQLPPEESFALSVHRRARQLLATEGAAALAPARVREDEELFTLVAELATLAERDRIRAEDPETIASTFAELAAAVELQFLDRRAGELKATMSTDDDMLEWKRIETRRRELHPSRARERAE